MSLPKKKFIVSSLSNRNLLFLTRETRDFCSFIGENVVKNKKMPFRPSEKAFRPSENFLAKKCDIMKKT